MSGIDKIRKNDGQWREVLSTEQYEVCRRQGTEQAFSGAYHRHDEEGVYYCVCCDAPLFDSVSKYDSGCGWPSFTRPAGFNSVEEHSDRSHGMQRTEIRCARCDAHLGHVFPDGPAPTRLRYCINSVALTFRGRETP